MVFFAIEFISSTVQNFHIDKGLWELLIIEALDAILPYQYSKTLLLHCSNFPLSNHPNSSIF